VLTDSLLASHIGGLVSENEANSDISDTWHLPRKITTKQSRKIISKFTDFIPLPLLFACDNVLYHTLDDRAAAPSDLRSAGGKLRGLPNSGLTARG
jgi:hypothetical protein